MEAGGGLLNAMFTIPKGNSHVASEKETCYKCTDLARSLFLSSSSSVHSFDILVTSHLCGVNKYILSREKDTRSG